MGDERDLVTDEGVNEGCTGEPGPGGDVVGEPPHGAPASEDDAAPPLDDGADDRRGPGQELAEGEG